MTETESKIVETATAGSRDINADISALVRQCADILVDSMNAGTTERTRNAVASARRAMLKALGITPRMKSAHDLYSVVFDNRIAERI